MAEIKFKTSDKVLEGYNKDIEIELKEANEKIKAMSDIISFLRKENVELYKMVEIKVTKEKSEFFLRYILNFYNIDKEALADRNRTKPLPFIRQIISYFLHRYFGWSMREIADYLYYAHHTDIVRGVQMIEKILDSSDRESMRDVLVHRNWVIKLSKV